MKLSIGLKLLLLAKLQLINCQQPESLNDYNGTTLPLIVESNHDDYHDGDKNGIKFQGVLILW